MKKTLIFACLLLFPAGWAGANDLPQTQQWTQSVDGAFATPLSTNDAQAFNLGWGVDGSIGYRFDPTFSLACVAGYYEYDIQNPPAGTSGHLSYIPLMLMPRLNLLMKGRIHPYFFLGAGLAFNTFSVTTNGIGLSQQETDLLLAPGLGAIFPVADNIALFLQGRVDIDFTSSGGLGKGVDSPSIFVPIQGGVGFFVL